MWLEQAVFTSTKTRHGEGYQVAARSPGVSNENVVALTRWCPSHASLQDTSVHAESLNYHPLSDRQFALSRTTYGLQEFSGRGGLQVVTIAIIFNQHQLTGYDGDALRMSRVARSLGALRWRPSFPERISPVEIPDQEVSESVLASSLPPSPADPVIQRVLSLTRANHRAVLLAKTNPEKRIETILTAMDAAERSTCFFSSGLKWSKQRTFQLQVMHDIDTRTRQRLHKNQVQIVDANDLASPFDSMYPATWHA